MSNESSALPIEIAGEDTTRVRLWNLESNESKELQGMAKLTHGQWLPDGSGVELTRAVGAFAVFDFS